MAITTSLRPFYAWRCIIIAVICFLFALWGLYDYVIKLPGQEQDYRRFVVVVDTKAALEGITTQSDDLTERFTTARNSVGRELQPLLDRHSSKLALPSADITMQEVQPFLLVLMGLLNDATIENNSPSMDVARQMADSITGAGPNERDWARTLLLFHHGLTDGQGQRGASKLRNVALQAYERAVDIQASTESTPPGRYDALICWVFILCLPFAPFYLWKLMSLRKVRYQLDDDGTLTGPEGTWPADEIASIDMSKWMAKSIATVAHKDGSTATLDDYLHKDLHLIVGALAHRFEPDQWTEEAKPVKDDEAKVDETPDESEVPGHEVTEAAVTDDPNV